MVNVANNPTLVQSGGTGTASFNVDGAVFSNTTGTGALSSATLTDGQILIGATGAAPAAGSITAGAGITVTPGTNSVTVAAIPTAVTDHAILIGGPGDTITSLLLTNGQLPIGKTGFDPTAATLTAGEGIGINDGAGAITISLNVPVTVSDGGTGVTSTTAYTPICGGTSPTNPIQSVASTGTAGQVLTSNGAGALPSFQAVTGVVNSINNQVFTSSGTYTPTAGMIYCQVQCLGGGGGGAGTTGTGSGVYVGAGGGSGEYAVGIFSAAAVGASQTVTIGAGGTAGSGSNGGSGGASSLGALISSGGGGGGTHDSVGGVGTGGTGGSGGSGGSYRSQGNYGQSATFQAAGTPFSGAGANSQLGAGGIGVFGAINPTSGVNASNYGAGGSGSANTINNGSLSGGTGSAGIIIITEYVS